MTRINGKKIVAECRNNEELEIKKKIAKIAIDKGVTMNKLVFDICRKYIEENNL